MIGNCIVCNKEFHFRGYQKTCPGKCRDLNNRQLARKSFLKLHPIKYSNCVICDKKFRIMRNEKTCQSMKCRKINRQQKENQRLSNPDKMAKRREQHKIYSMKKYQKNQVALKICQQLGLMEGI